MNGQQDMATVICETTLTALVRLASPPLKPEECGKASELLRAEVKEGYSALLAELKEASEAFHGQESILRQVLAVGCMKFAADALTKLRPGNPKQVIAAIS